MLTASGRRKRSASADQVVPDYPTGWDSVCAGMYPYGTVITLTAWDFSNQRLGIYWTFDHWEGALQWHLPTCTVSMTAARNARAVFIDAG